MTTDCDYYCRLYEIGNTIDILGLCGIFMNIWTAIHNIQYEVVLSYTVIYRLSADGSSALWLICDRQSSPSYITDKKMETCKHLWTMVAYLVKSIHRRMLECFFETANHDSYPKFLKTTSECRSRSTDRLEGSIFGDTLYQSNCSIKVKGIVSLSWPVYPSPRLYGRKYHADRLKKLSSQFMLFYPTLRPVKK